MQAQFLEMNDFKYETIEGIPTLTVRFTVLADPVPRAITCTLTAQPASSNYIYTINRTLSGDAFLVVFRSFGRLNVLKQLVTLRASYLARVPWPVSGPVPAFDDDCLVRVYQDFPLDLSGE